MMFNNQEIATFCIPLTILNQTNQMCYSFI